MITKSERTQELHFARLDELPIDRVRFPQQVRDRFDEEPLGGLAQSIATTGLQQPIRVRPAGDGWVVVDGERRVRAALLLGWISIPAIVDESGTEGAAIVEHQLVADRPPSDRTQIGAENGADKSTQAPGWTAARIAVAVAVAALVDLLQLPLHAVFATGFLAFPSEIAILMLDALAFGVSTALLGFHWALVPVGLFEMVPGVGAVPTWTMSVAYVAWQRKRELGTGGGS